MLCFRSASANLPLCHTILVHYQCVGAICHCGCVESSTKPGVGRTRHGNGGLSTLRLLFTDVSFNGACPAFDFPARGDGIPLASLDGCSIRIGYLLTIHATTPASRCLPAKLLALIPGLPGSLQRGAFHFKGSDPCSHDSHCNTGQRETS